MKKNIEIGFFLLVLLMVLNSCSGNNDNQNNKEKAEVRDNLTEADLLHGNWKLVSIDEKEVPEERRGVTVDFNKNGNFSRRISEEYEPEEGTWFIENYEGRKYLSFQIEDMKEMNELVSLSEKELIFKNRNKAIKLLKTK